VYLEKLELQGFKSFVHKTTLTFPQPRGGEKRGTAAIVGPNGSGKSNLSDAVRWVMGEQSIKSLRGKKSEDVIFSGTDKLARVGLAEVSLYLNNEDHQAPIDFSQVVVTRRLYRSGESEYLINKKRVRLQDVTLLLAQASFGQKTYSIIGQGMVDAILAASPLERKEYFDEASGTRPLQLKREDALLKLRQADDNLRQGEVLMQEINPRLRSLTRQVKRLERREEIAKELLDVRQRYFGSQHFYINSNLQKEQAILDKISEERKKEESFLSKLEEQFSVMEKSIPADQRFTSLQEKHGKLWDVRGELKEKLLSAKQALSSAETKLSNTHQLSQTDLLSLHRDMEQTVSELVSLSSGDNIEVSTLKVIVDKIQFHVKNLKKQIVGEEKTSDSSLKKLEEELAKLIADEKALADELTKVQAEMKDFHSAEEQKNKAIFELERQVRTARESLANMITKENEYKVNLARLATTKESLDLQISEEFEGATLIENKTIYSEPEKEGMRRDIDRLKHRLAEIGGIDEETAKEYEETKQRYEFLEKESNDLRQGIQDLRKVIKDLDGTIDRQFNDSFQRINRDFEKFFKIIFSGGIAKLVKVSLPVPSAGLVDTDVVVEDGEENNQKELKNTTEQSERLGIDIQATPPGKRLKSINMLSGGERALTSLALICAIISNNPSPFVVLDEVDAALDEANSVRFAEIIDQLSHNTQFVVITHNRATMHQSNILYGVTMGDDGASKILSLKLEDISKE